MWKYNLKTTCIEEPVECRTCDGVGWYEGGETLKTTCPHCCGTGIIINRSIPVSGKTTWEDGEDVTDKFTVEEENFEKVVVPIVDFSKVVYLADACPEKNQPIEYGTDRELEESLFNGVSEEIKNKIISESDWRATNGHGGVDEVTKENFIQAAIFGYLLSQPKEHKSDENSLPKSDIEQEAEKYELKNFVEDDFEIANDFDFYEACANFYDGKTPLQRNPVQMIGDRVRLIKCLREKGFIIKRKNK